ncbi:methionyl-tRNA formyltransferase [Candidatus Saccharibacteria bacterium]|nr:methionyl-tRNA formyltransferase [Candidatus Saccharibacteria bacterium]
MDIIKPKSVVFFGSSELSAHILQSLIDQPSPRFTITAVVTRPTPPHGHSHQADTPVVRIANAHNIRLFRPSRASELVELLGGEKLSAGLLFAYGQILPPEVLSLFEYGILNIHPSLLPKHRGPSPIEATILAGDSQAGVSLIKITDKMDAGPILVQKHIVINDSISKAELTTHLVSVALDLTHQTLPDFADGLFEAKLRENLIPNQNEAEATYCKLIHKQDGLIWLNQELSASVQRKVRAYADWPKTRLAIKRGDSTMELLLLETGPPSTGLQLQPGLTYQSRHLFAQCQDQAIELRRIQLPGKQAMTAPELLNGPALSVLVEPGQSFIELNRE